MRQSTRTRYSSVPFSRRSGQGGLMVLIIAAILALVVVAFVRSRSGGGGAHTALVGFDNAIAIDAAMAKAKQEGKPTLLFFTASWCPPCKQMKSDVLPQDAIASTIRDNFVGVYVDIDERGADASAYGITGVPTFIVFNKDGQEVARQSGGMSASEFKQLLAAR
jgi:thiol:disulfide interchange protein